MDIHEYQAKKILSSYGVQILDGELALNASEAVAAFNKLNSDICVVKAQVHSGARGKAGGIILCKTEEEVKIASNKLFGTHLKTIQTGVEGKIIEKLYIGTWGIWGPMWPKTSVAFSNGAALVCLPWRPWLLFGRGRRLAP